MQPDQPAIQLLCGPSNSGKVAEIHTRFLEACADGGEAWLVLPAQGDVERTLRELCAKAGALVGGRVVTFPQLVQELGAEPGRQRLPRAAETILAQRLLERHARRFPERRFGGFVRTAATRLRELRSLAAVDPQSLAQQIESMDPAEAAAWTALLGDLSSWIDTAGLVDDAWLERSALVAASAGALAGPLFAYGFDDLDTSQRCLLRAAAAHVPVVVSMPYEPDRVVFERRSELVQEFVQAGAAVELGGTARFASPTLAALERSLFDEAGASLDTGPTDVRFVEAAGDLQQAEAIAREVVRELRRGTPPDRIACLTTAPQRSRTLLEACLRRVGVGATVELPTPLETTSAGRGLMAALDALVDDDPAAALRHARSPVSGLDPGQAEQAEREWRAAGRDPWWATGRLAMLRGAPAQGWLEVLRAFVAGCSVETAQDAAVIDLVLDSLDELSRTPLAERFSAADARRLFAALQLPAPTSRPGDCIVVAPVSRVRTDTFDAVVLYDLHDGGWGNGGEEPLVDRELAYVAVTRARQRLVCVRQSARSDGRARAPHPLWVELREHLLPEAPILRLGLGQLVPGPAAIVSVHDSTLAAAAAGSLQPVASRGATRVAPIAQPLEQVSVTEIERYAACSAQWFIERRLLAGEDEPPSSPAIVGTLVHELLAELVPRLPAATAADIREQAEVVVARLSERARRQSSRPLGDYIRPVHVDAAVLAVELFLRDEQPPPGTVLTELRTGDERHPIRLEVAGVPVRGRIDRIDVDGETAVIHDYKSRTLRADDGAAGMVRAGRLQLPLYWKAIRESPECGIPEPAAAVYRPVRSQARVKPALGVSRGLVRADAREAVDRSLDAALVRTDVVDPATVDEVLEAALEEAERAVEGMRAGRVQAAPRDESICTWCGLQPVCRVGGR